MLNEDPAVEAEIEKIHGRCIAHSVPSLVVGRRRKLIEVSFETSSAAHDLTPDAEADAAARIEEEAKLALPASLL